MPTFRQSMLALLALLSLPADATDYTVEYGGGPPPAPISGRLNDDLFLGDVDRTFHRLGGSCDDTPLEGDYLYDTIALTNTGTSEFDINVEINTGVCDSSHDSVVIGYSPSFDPANPQTNCLVYDDDSGEQLCSRVSTTIAPSQTVVFVVTAWQSWPTLQTWPWTAKFNDRLYEDDFECLSVDDFNCSGSP